MVSESRERHVALCADVNYLPFLGIVAYSLLANNPGPGLTIHVITDRLPDADRRRFDELSRQFGTVIHHHQLSTEDWEELARVNVRGRFGIATFFRLLIPRAVPARVRKVLYLDADMIVDADLTELFDAPIEGKALGACRDPVAERLKGRAAYFNSGTLMFNLPVWRNENLVRRIIDCASDSNFPFCEQDALNEVIPSERVEWLDLKYNFMVYDRLKSSFRGPLDEALAAAGEPRILHFTGAIKPWHRWYAAPFKDKFRNYAMRSPWRDVDFWKERPANLQEEMWLGDLAWRNADFRSAAAQYAKVARALMRRSGGKGE